MPYIRIKAYPKDEATKQKVVEAINKASLKKIPYFGLAVPEELPGVDTGILDPRNTYQDPEEWNRTAVQLATRFKNNFHKFEDTEAGRKLAECGPDPEK